ncbi:DNA polymerase [Sphingomonas kyeonggiensis]|uniref:DNA polymerase n=1 Tax=Sphingomonas kyeonggiensis TaxID=1268553 RepID=A0A7W7NSP0_9SPHN|nr:uracil-DNA glycosylase family protein [Sphingomonas kyeonggiensis]MBB4839102.1 DNA polymerase [Sphingomonas kyeonggiensis]
MGGEYTADWGRTLASALEWWRDAGVETLQEDEARDWLARPAPVQVAQAAVTSPQPEVLPDTLAAFTAWRTGETVPEAGWLTPKIAPTGPLNAPLVVLTDMPESDDQDALLGDSPAGKLFSRMLTAAGVARDSVYFVSLAVARPLAGRIPPDQEARLIEITRHHLKLLQPAKLLILGQTASRAVAETNDGPPANGLVDVNHFGGHTEAVASLHPRFLLDRPAAKSEAWKHLLLLTRGSL